MSNIKGTVKWWNDAKGYGFITSDEHNDVFVHYTAITGDNFKTLEENQEVTFDLITGAKGVQATNVIRGKKHEQENTEF